MSRLDTLYQANRERPSDMQVHVPTLATLAHDKSILELGVRYGVSTAAFLYGRPKFMVSVDMNPFIYEESYAAIAKEENLNWRFLRQDSRVPVAFDFDMLFIDTTHQYGHVVAELNAHVRTVWVRWIVLHDTVLFGEYGDVGWPGANSNIDVHGQLPPELRGQLPAIREFLQANPAWQIYHHYDYKVMPDMTAEDHYKLGCGLMVLRRD